MKRFLFSLLLLSLFSLGFAAQVGLHEAYTIAKNAYYEKVNLFHKQEDINDLFITDHFFIQKNGETMMYAFNFSSLGFIIISADDAIRPVIGYSFESQYNPASQPDNSKGWLDGRAGAVQFVRENNLTASPELMASWKKYSEISNIELLKGGKSIEPLLTATWNQDWPYNYYCPLDAAGPGGRVYVGCVATAMSMIMQYWRFPNEGTGSHSYYCPGYGTLSADFGSTTYDWNGMVDNSDQKINLPMALIGYHAGIAVDMEYGPDGSGAQSHKVDDALKNYFNYDDSVVYITKSNYQWSAWHAIIQTELELLRPLYYSGRDGSGSGSSGHAFVLDGYNSDGNYHFNFGWSGQDNGWYDIEDPNGYEWYVQQGMVRKIFPDDDAYPYGCDPDFIETNLIGSITDGSGPQQNYDPSVSCQWLIDPQTAYDSITKIQLNFVALDTESEDIITIYDGETTSAPVLGTYSGNPATMPPYVMSTGNKMLIVFTADGDANTASGFRVEYFTYLPNWCTGLTTFTETSGSFNDGSNDWYYKNQTNCMWKVTPPWASNLTVSFTEFNTEAGADVVKIYDASNNSLLATYSGVYTSGNMPAPVTIPSGKLFMTFQSDGAINKPGWTAEWVIANTAIEDTEAGFDQLLIYPNPAENLLNVSFSLEQDQSLNISLISAAGTVVYTENKTNASGNYINTIDLSDFAKGVYFLNIKGDRGTITEKVVIK